MATDAIRLATITRPTTSLPLRPPVKALGSDKKLISCCRRNALPQLTLPSASTPHAPPTSFLLSHDPTQPLIHRPQSYLRPAPADPPLSLCHRHVNTPPIAPEPTARRVTRGQGLSGTHITLVASCPTSCLWNEAQRSQA
nr:hypothetical protein CFP56_11348 [Quercus suber]